MLTSATKRILTAAKNVAYLVKRAIIQVRSLSPNVERKASSPFEIMLGQYRPQVR